MTGNVSLTIGIPTYNRKDAVLERIKKLLATGLPKNVTVLVIDNDSNDGTYESLIGFVKNEPSVRVLRNKQNIGYAGNFFEVLDCADSDYILYCSDEDDVNLNP